MEAIIFIGIQASGKSTFFQQRFFATHVRINLDMLKTRNRERILLAACLEAKQLFVIDKTNLTREARAGYISQAKAAGFSVAGYYFKSEIQAALERNRQRSGKALIPEKGILGAYRRLELPSLGEGFDRLFYVEIGANGQFLVKEWSNEV
ncbi:MAG TPA: AAA family ATPase [Blastocatellia bacterium]|nr:AAA family ATPase [Blastocatellia bacterium]HMV84884.1 AAA family ATPase [Blastocatellia bacterium]HMX30146.1 AAA family ATPase [Blastocatellia bacterium]HMZ23190.1 AAA family ATPase [Blastocatellia bacterium]HNG33952.1 AAA family ATPase [Blastocatellia bacterium]